MRSASIFVATAFLLTAGPGARAGEEPDKSMEIMLETDGAAFRGLSKKTLPARAPEVHRQTLRKGFYYIEALDAAGKVLYVRTMPPVDEVFYDYQDAPASGAPGISTGPAAAQAAPDRPFKGGSIKLEKSQFNVSLPFDPDIKSLRINIIKDAGPLTGKKTRKVSGSRHPAAALAPAARELKTTLDLGAIPEEK